MLVEIMRVVDDIRGLIGGTACGHREKWTWSSKVVSMVINGIRCGKHRQWHSVAKPLRLPLRQRLPPDS